MLGRMIAPALVALACGCSSAPPEIYRPPPPRATQAAPAPSPSAPAPPRRITGKPVALVPLGPTKTPGIEWVWLMPEGKLVTLIQPDAEGRRAILAPNFFMGPKRAFVEVEPSGELELLAD